MFGSRPEKNDPEIDKLNFWFTLIGPKYASAVPKNLGVGVDFRLFSEGDFLSGRP